MNPVLRWLDEPPKFLGFSGVQWVWLILGTATLAGLLRLLGVPLTPALSVMILIEGPPAAVIFLGEQTGTGATQLVLDALRWRTHPHRYDTAGTARPAGVLVAEPTPSRLSAARLRPQRHDHDRAGARP